MSGARLGAAVALYRMRRAGCRFRGDRGEAIEQEPLPVAFRPVRIKVIPKIAGEFRDLSLSQFDANNQAQREELSAWVMQSIAPIGSNVPVGKGRP